MTCKTLFHASCVRLNRIVSENIRPFECANCVLSAMDPLNCPMETIIGATLLVGKGTSVNFDVSTELYLKLGKKHHSVEIRCIRIDGGKDMYETTWPDSAESSLNGHKLKEYLPL